MIKFILAAILSFVCVACNKEQKPISKRDFISQLVKTHMAMPFSDSVGYNTIQLNKLMQEETLIYIMDASCSACIYTFIEFFKQVENTCNSKIYVIIDEDYLPQVEYHLSKAKVYSNIKKLEIICNTTNKYIKGNIENADLNGRVIYDVNKQVIYIGSLANISNSTF